MDIKNLEKIRHSLAHILAMSVQELYPKVKFGMGPAIENGFYYDFDLGGDVFTQDDLKSIEKEMEKIVKENQKFEHFVLPIGEAKEKVSANPYKTELLEELEKEGEKEISFYRNLDRKGNEVFCDMCRVPHLAETKQV